MLVICQGVKIKGAATHHYPATESKAKFFAAQEKEKQEKTVFWSHFWVLKNLFLTEGSSDGSAPVNGIHLMVPHILSNGPAQIRILWLWMVLTCPIKHLVHLKGTKNEYDCHQMAQV